VRFNRGLLRFVADPSKRTDDSWIHTVLNRFRSHFDGRRDYFVSIGRVMAGGQEPSEAIAETVKARLGGKFDERDQNQIKYLKVAGIINKMVVDRREVTLEAVLGEFNYSNQES